MHEPCAGVGAEVAYREDVGGRAAGEARLVERRRLEDCWFGFAEVGDVVVRLRGDDVVCFCDCGFGDVRVGL